MSSLRSSGGSGWSTQKGLTLVELMIAMVLGLVVIGSVIAIFMSNRQSYLTNNALGYVQDNTRVAFELLARDIRQAGNTGCGNDNRVANVLNNQAAWYANWNNSIIGYQDASTDPALAGFNPVKGTNSIELLSATGMGLSVAKHDPKSATIFINEPTPDIQAGDIVVVCDPDHAAITQITNYNSSNRTVVHNTGTASPGDCSKGLGYPTDCSSNLGNQYAFPRNSSILKFSATDWYIGHNPVGGDSLYRITEENIAGATTSVSQEMVRNVTGMVLTYHVANTSNFIDAASMTAANWLNVDAVRVALTLESSYQRAGTNLQPASPTTSLPSTFALVRNMATTITVRNRVE